MKRNLKTRSPRFFSRQIFTAAASVSDYFYYHIQTVSVTGTRDKSEEEAFKRI